ncbi:hypothetical protein IQ238_09460 [Pleurocapsales cyanobacterium LEGE 06147]|nr:hypothetical protein [Pleurocapsales cyanobacterium LEGE 06147]
MTKPLRILLQTTLLPTEEDDWTIARFSLLRDYLASLKDEIGNPLCEVTARDREPDADGHDPVLSNLDRANFDELWLFALDVGGGLSSQDCAGITKFHQQGGGILATRDHQDMGISMCTLENIGCFHYFNTRQPDPDESRCCRDDPYTSYISWPNYHSGNNGDYQIIEPVEPVHELLKNPNSPEGVIKYFPAHPHEGGIGVPKDTPQARVIAVGKSKVTGRQFNLVVACDSTNDKIDTIPGRVVAQSTFHHFVDYNWDISKGCPSFVEELPGDGMKQELRALEDIHAYVKNLALWLAPE